MDWHFIFLDVIDMRSFSNLWFWISLAVLWSAASHWVLGVPFDMVTQARRRGGQAETDLDDIARINANRVLSIAEDAGIWAIAVACFAMAALTLLAFVYWIELAQAFFLLGFPLSLVLVLSLRTASLIRSEQARGALVQKRLSHLRLATQVIGILSIFVTSLWGMYHNLSAGILG